MSEIKFRARARPVGNSLSVIIPAAKRRQGGIRPDQEIEVVIRTEPSQGLEALGALKRLGIPDPGPFGRKGLWRERL